MAELQVCTSSRLPVIDVWLLSKPNITLQEEHVGSIGVGMELFHFHLPRLSTAFLTFRNISY